MPASAGLLLWLGGHTLMFINDPHELTTHQMAQFNRQTGIGLLMGLINAIVLTTTLWRVAEHALLAAWLAALVFASLVRLLVARTYAEPERSNLRPGYWVTIHFSVTILVGLAWGGGAILLFPADALPQQILLVLIFGLTATAALPMHIAMPNAYAVFLACVFGPLFARLLLADQPAFHTVAALLPVVAVALWMTARSMHYSLMESLSLHFNFRNLANLDGLTQVPNRRHFDAVLTNEWNRAARARIPLSVILIDVDKFKTYNDTYGHQAGDVCLQRVARALSDNLRRAGDMVARYGGEEFVLLLHQTPRDDGVMLAERLRAAVEQLAIEHAGSDCGVVTISVGGATVIPDPHGEERALLQRADECLYRAKHGGRNRVMWAAATGLERAA